VELANRGRLVMPAILELRLKDGGAKRVTVPVEAWRQSNTIAVDLPVDGEVTEIVLDPDHKLPLADRAAKPVKVR
jgi:hypothetical protein